MSTPGAGEGAVVIAEALKAVGVKYVFGIVGVPVIELGFACQNAGLAFFAMRNEQAASYAAAAVGYATGIPGACLVVSGPGVVHGLAGLSNALSNGWPMILIGGASDANQDGTGAFQEGPQVEWARPHVKAAARPDSLDRFPFFIDRLCKAAVAGRPGPVYLDVPGQLVNTTPSPAALAAAKALTPLAPLPLRRMSAPTASFLDAAATLLQTAKRPLFILGKGAAYARAEGALRALVEQYGGPFLPSPMGKGVLPDSHPQNVIAARSLALKSADVIVLFGARLNWMLHFGAPPRFAKDVKIISVDIDAVEAAGVARAPTLSTVSDCAVAAEMLAGELRRRQAVHGGDSAWWTQLRSKVAANVKATDTLAADTSVPLNYYCVFREVQGVLQTLPKAPYIASEGANTMDIGRTMLPNEAPRLRLDAGTFGTMGVGLAQAIAAAALVADGHPDAVGRRVIAVEGDSAVGFSGMEIESMVRYKMPIVIIVVSNSGVGFGAPIDPSGSTMSLARGGAPPTSLSSTCRYDRVCEALGGRGWFVERPEQIQPALRAALAVEGVPSLIHIVIASTATRKTQEFDWLSRGDNKDAKL